MDGKQANNEPKLTVPITPALIRRVRAHIAGKANRGKKASSAKRAAAKENGKKGGRPRRRQLELKIT